MLPPIPPVAATSSTFAGWVGAAHPPPCPRWCTARTSSCSGATPRGRGRACRCGPAEAGRPGGQAAEVRHGLAGELVGGQLAAVPFPLWPGGSPFLDCGCPKLWVGPRFCRGHRELVRWVVDFWQPLGGLFFTSVLPQGPASRVVTSQCGRLRSMGHGDQPIWRLAEKRPGRPCGRGSRRGRQYCGAVHRRPRRRRGDRGRGGGGGRTPSWAVVSLPHPGGSGILGALCRSSVLALPEGAGLTTTRTFPAHTSGWAQTQSR